MHTAVSYGGGGDEQVCNILVKTAITFMFMTQ
jgi:hypothetical protein